MTIPQQILTGLSAIGGKGTCGQIASEIRLSRKDVEKNISKLVRAGKAKVVDPKGSLTINKLPANIYAIVQPDEVKTEQSKLF